MFLESTNRAGWIEVVCGSMFSGKTEELIRRLKRAQFARRGQISKQLLTNCLYLAKVVPFRISFPPYSLSLKSGCLIYLK